MDVAKRATTPVHHSQWHDRLDNQPRVAGRSLFQLAELAGGTPFYVYDRRAIRERVELLRRTLPPSIQLHYAIKANPMPAVVNLLAGLVDGLDVASHREMLTALGTGLSPTEISFAGPGKSQREVDAAVAAGIVVIAESFDQIDALARAGKRLGTAPSIALRVNPSFELKSSGMRMTGGSKPFGIDAEQIAEAVARCRHQGMEPVGLHLFTGSQNLNASALCEAHRGALELALEYVTSLQLQLRFINIGGGLGIPYFPGERPLDLAPVADNLAQLVARAKTVTPDSALVMEMGRFLVGEAGLYVCRVLERKLSRGTTYLITDGGLHHHLSNSGNFGQVIRKNYPLELVTREQRDELELVTVVGPLCTPLDIVADKMSLPKAAVGDLVVVRQSGAYGLSASPTRFLSHPEPQELLL